ncbi:hypothetical protein MMC30_003147 [Trapelia coarctata]|nr:hypothetical protein [Trapelia coarctata]
MASTRTYLSLILFYYQLTSIIAVLDFSAPTCSHSEAFLPLTATGDCRKAVALISEGGSPAFVSFNKPEYHIPAIFYSVGCVIIVESQGKATRRPGVAGASVDTQPRMWLAVKEVAENIMSKCFRTPSTTINSGTVLLPTRLKSGKLRITVGGPWQGLPRLSPDMKTLPVPGSGTYNIYHAKHIEPTVSDPVYRTRFSQGPNIPSRRSEWWNTENVEY